MNAPSVVGSTTITVMIVDDHPLVRIGMTTVLNQQSDMRVIAQAESGEQARSRFRLHRPDVVLMDLRLRHESGARITSELCAEFPTARVLIISNYEGDEHIHQALNAGARGYLFKSVVEDELLDAIREVHGGGRYLPHGVAMGLAENRAGGALTPREQELFALLGKGLSNRELGRVLGVTEATVKSHLKSLFRKLEVSDRAEAVREGFRRGFLLQD